MLIKHFCHFAKHLLHVLNAIYHLFNMCFCLCYICSVHIVEVKCSIKLLFCVLAEVSYLLQNFCQTCSVTWIALVSISFAVFHVVKAAIFCTFYIYRFANGAFFVSIPSLYSCPSNQMIDLSKDDIFDTLTGCNG